MFRKMGRDLEPLFDAYFRAVQSGTHQLWEAEKGSTISPDEQARVAKAGGRIKVPLMRAIFSDHSFQFYRSAFWYDRLLTLAECHDSGWSRSYEDLWEAFRHVFSPALFTAEEMRGRHCRDFQVLQHLLCRRIKTMRSAEIFVIRQASDDHCHGPFTDDELEFVRRRHSRLFEVASGSGAVVRAVNALGGDAIGSDTNHYRRDPNVEHPFTVELRQRGLFIDGSGPDIISAYGDRSLEISWPEPGTAFTADTLERYQDAHGGSFLLKVGGLVGKRRCSDDTDPNIAENVRRLYRLLATEWRQAAHMPKFDPRHWENNLWAFDRR